MSSQIIHIKSVSKVSWVIMQLGINRMQNFEDSRDFGTSPIQHWGGTFHLENYSSQISEFRSDTRSPFLQSGILTHLPKPKPSLPILLTMYRLATQESQNNHQLKLNFPKFDGEDPMGVDLQVWTVLNFKEVVWSIVFNLPPFTSKELHSNGIDGSWNSEDQYAGMNSPKPCYSASGQWTTKTHQKLSHG